MAPRVINDALLLQMKADYNCDVSASDQMAIWSQIIEADRDPLPADVANYLLRWGFDDSAQARIDLLSSKAQAGALSEMERSELDEYVRVNHFLTVLHSKARRSVQAARGVA